MSTNNTSMVSIMFEEIKQLLKEKKNQAIKVDTTRIESLIANIKITKTNNEELLEKMEQIHQSVSNPPKQSIKHSHIIEIKSTKVFVTLILMAISLIISLAFNAIQHNKNTQLADNDLKYRHIKAANGIDSTHIYQLENLFEYNRDKDGIKKFRKNIELYELQVIEQAKRMEQAKFKEKEAERLKKEAEELKK